MGVNPSALDAYDMRILYELDVNCRMPTSTIAKNINKSKQFVEYRIKKLEEQKVIVGYNTVIDYSRLGYLSMRVYFKFHNLTREQQNRIEEELIQDKEVWWLVTLEGRWDVGYAVAITNILDYYKYWDTLMKKYKPFIKERSVVVYTHIHQFAKSYLIKKDNLLPGTIVGASTQKADIDKKDMLLLKTIAANGRISLIDISNEIGLTPAAAKYRLNNLERKKVIQGYRALIDVSHFNYRYYKSYVNFLNYEKYEELVSFCKMHPNILTINKTIGGHDFEIELQAKTFDEFDNIMNQIRNNFAGMIDYYEFVIARQEKKMNYFPFNNEDILFSS